MRYLINENDLDVMFKLLIRYDYPLVAGDIVYRTKESIKNIREKLAELEHVQWAHWTKYMLDNMTPENIERWRLQTETDYKDLSDKERDSDREWADRVIDVIVGD